MSSKAIGVAIPRGTYFLGDPGYVFGQEAWGEAVKSLGPVHRVGEHRFVAFPVGGDGEYRDVFRNVYSVDSGLIGVVPQEAADPEKLLAALAKGLGRLVVFNSPTLCKHAGGFLSFGDTIIDAGTSFDEDVDEEIGTFDMWEVFDDE